ncbi:MAG: ATP-binding protein [Cyclobacteriaceae bacterium]
MQISLDETVKPVKSLPAKWVWWAWPLLLTFLVSISYGSYYLRNFTDSVLLYLPTPFAIILLYWYGPRMLPIIFLNEIVTLLLWGASGSWIRISLIAMHAPVMTYASWFFYKRTNNEGLKDMLSSTDSFIRFVLLGVFVPVLINSLFTYHYTFVNRDFYVVSLIFLADFLTILTIATPLLYFLAPKEDSFRFTISKPFATFSLEQRSPKAIQFWLIVIGFVAMIFFVDFDAYWYIYGVISIIVAIQRGFATVILINCIIFILNYILPVLDFADIFLASKGSTKSVSIHLGMLAMIISSSLIGRVISDLWKIEYKLTEQKKELESANSQLTKTNSELDRFVYSLSHDISAPLKSIKGLVNLSRIENSPEQSALYLSKIDMSINKLESFIAEVLDYSRTNRAELQSEKIRISNVIMELIEDFKYLENFQEIEFQYDFASEYVMSDKFLLKVILSNLISNAIKYQKVDVGHKPFINISSGQEGQFTKIKIEDNGEGIAPQSQERIFEMFYRGSSNSTGSGLGLYILKEAIEKLNGKIEMNSELGKGSSFIILIPLPAQV